MAVATYPAIIERSDTGYSVFFPDLPGCTSAGATISEATVAASEALAGHLLASAEHGDAVPHARSLDEIEHDPEVIEVARILVSAS